MRASGHYCSAIIYWSCPARTCPWLKVLLLPSHPRAVWLSKETVLKCEFTSENRREKRGVQSTTSWSWINWQCVLKVRLRPKQLSRISKPLSMTTIVAIMMIWREGKRRSKDERIERWPKLKTPSVPSLMALEDLEPFLQQCGCFGGSRPILTMSARLDKYLFRVCRAN